MARNWFGYSSAERVVQRYSLAMRYATVVAAAAVALSGATVVVLVAGGPAHSAVTPPALTSQQAADKAAICAQFNSNVQMPLVVIPSSVLAADCPLVGV